MLDHVMPAFLAFPGHHGIARRIGVPHISGRLGLATAPAALRAIEQVASAAPPGEPRLDLAITGLVISIGFAHVSTRHCAGFSFLAMAALAHMTTSSSFVSATDNSRE